MFYSSNPANVFATIGLLTSRTSRIDTAFNMWVSISCTQVVIKRCLLLINCHHLRLPRWSSAEETVVGTVVDFRRPKA